jgi:prophage regulatory protein
VGDESARIIREPERKRITGLSRVSWWRLERAGLAPRRVRIGVRAMGWHAASISKWVAERPTVANDARPEVAANA